MSARAAEPTSIGLGLRLLRSRKSYAMEIATKPRVMASFSIVRAYIARIFELHISFNSLAEVGGTEVGA
jgi:hypothetical protein